MKKIIAVFLFFTLFSTLFYGQKPELKLPIGHTGTVTSVCFSPDGRYALSSSEDHTLKLWDVQSGKEIKSFEGHTMDVTSACFSPDGRYALSGSIDKTLKLWDIQTGKEIRSFEGYTDAVTSTCFSPDGRYALSGSYDKILKLWDVQSGKEIKSFEGHTNVVNSVCFSPDGRYALSGCGYQAGPRDYTLKLWDIQSGKEIKSFEGHSYNVTSVCFSPDGRYALSGSGDNTLKLWDIQSGKEIKSFEGHTNEVTSVCFSPDGRYALSGSYDNILKLWDIQSGKEVKSFKGHTSWVSSVCFSPDGLYALSGSYDNTIKLWDIQSGKEIKSFEGHTNVVTSVCFSPDGWYAMTGGGNKVGPRNYTLKLWDIQSGKEIKSFEGHTNVVNSVCFSPDGRYALSGSYDNTIRFWDIQSGKEIKSFEGHTSKVNSVCFSPNGRYALSGSSDNTLKLWDIQSGKEIKSLKGHTSTVTSVCFSPDSRYALSGSWDNTLKLWDIQSGKELKSFEGHTWWVMSVCFSPDGRYALSSAGDNTLKLWDIQSGKEIKSFEGHSSGISSVCFSPDGRYALSGSFDNTLKLWDNQSGKEIISFEGHTDGVSSVCFSPDGRYALSGSYDNTLKLWDIKKGNEIATLISVDSTDWIVTTPSGLFDASEGAMKQMYFVVGMDIIEFDQLKRRYWQPGLLPILLGYSNGKLKEVPALNYVRLCPDKKLELDKDKLIVHLQNRGGGIGKVNVFIDDIQVIPDARQSPSDSTKENLTLEVDLSRFSELLNYGQVNVVKVIAWNAEDYISSRADTIHYIPHRKDAKGTVIVSNPDIPMSRPALWAVVVGTSDYSGSTIDLHYAANDAIDFANTLALGANRLFGADSTHITLLTTEQKDRYPTKANIEKAFLQLKNTLPKDIVVVYFSGHGVNYGSGDGDFYYLTADASSTDAEYFSDPAMSYNYSVSGTELVKWLQVPARKKLVILDACAAGRGAETMAMAMKDNPKSQERILDQMQTLSGIYILAGAAGDKSSYESSRYGQGLLTYCMLKGMQGAQLKKEGGEEYVDVPLLLHYAVNEVPRLAQEEGYNQQPFVRSPNVQSLLYIGRMTEEDKKQIVLSEPKPVFISSKFQNSDLLAMDIRLEDNVNAQLREIMAKGREAKLTFRDGTVPGAYQIRGQYTIKEDTIKVKYILVKDNEIVGQQMESLVTSKDMEELAKEIVLKAGNLAK